MFELLSEHQFWTAVVIYWIFSAAVSSMPDPAGNGSSGYLWLYRFLHTIAGNITTAFGSRIPGLKTFTLLLVALLAAATSACAARYTIHPGALNKPIRLLTTYCSSPKPPSTRRVSTTSPDISLRVRNRLLTR